MSDEARDQREKKFVMIAVAFVFAFAFCWLPFAVYASIVITARTEEPNDSVSVSLKSSIQTSTPTCKLPAKVRRPRLNPSIQNLKVVTPSV